MEKIKNKVAWGLLILVLVLCSIAGRDFLSMRTPDPIYPSASLTGIVKLSNYFAGLKGTNGDADVYFFDSGNPGATVLLLGGTHPNEPSGFMTAILLIENVKVNAGKLIVIPQACLSGFTCTDPLEGYPDRFTLYTKMGERTFRFGSRVSNPLDQWPDPLVYLHYPSGQQLSSFETRNLNRAYPGKADGTFTEKIGYSIVNLIKKEKVTVAFDLHEAAPEIPIINAIISHEKGRDINAGAILNLELENLSYAMEMSPPKFRGLSHREWGDNTDVIPFLMETSNPIQGRLRGVTGQDLILRGYDDRYKTALLTGKFRVTYDTLGEPLSKRVARHLEGFKAVMASYNDFYPDKKFEYENIPGYTDLIERKIEQYLH